MVALLVALASAGPASAGLYDAPNPPAEDVAKPQPAPTTPVATAPSTESPLRLAAVPRVGTPCQVGGSDLPGRANAVRSWNARIVGVTGLRTRPLLSKRPFRYLRPFAPLGGGDVNLLITGRHCDARRRAWLRVYVPQRPNGSQAWILRDYAVITRNDYRIVIRQGPRTLTLLRRNRRVFRTKIAIGKVETPTPRGRFAIAEKVPTGNPANFLGPLVLPLTGFSETLNEYAGGNGRVAIHGTSLPHLIGTRASHGCIRMRNGDVLRLGRVVRPGTPVLIVR